MVSDREGGRSEGGVIGLKTLSLLLALIAALGCMADAHAQSFPSRPVTIVVPYGPGGPADILARIMAERMRGPLGQPVVVENVAGAAGTMGVSRVVRAAPDGYTLSYGNWGTHVLNGVIQKVNYDVLTDLDPIALLPDNPYIAVTNAAVPVNDFREMMAWLKANPNTASQGTGGSGSGSHVIGIYFQSLTGTQYQFVPYRQGTAGQTQDILSGQIQMMFDQPSNAVPHVRSGRIKAHAVLAKDRLAMAPEIPTVDEAGLPGFHVFHLVRTLGAEGHTAGYRCEAQRGGGRGARRSGGGAAAHRHGLCHYLTRPANTRSTRRAPQGGDREVVRDRQGGRCQSGVE